jgi:hypothetical protein
MTTRVTALPPHGIHFHINNRFRQNNEGAWAFTVPARSIPIDSGFYLMQIKQVVTENFIRTIQPGLNDVFAVLVNGTSYETLLPSRYYTVDTLVAALNTFLATINPALQLTYDYDFRLLSINIPVATSFAFVSPQLNISYQYRNDYPSRYDRLLSMLGFLGQSNTVYTGATVISATNEINLKYTSSIRLVTNQHCNVVGTDDENQQVLISIPITVPFGETIAYEPAQPRTFAFNSNVFDSFRISVVDDYNNRLDVPEFVGLNISMTLLQAATPFG